MALSTITSRAQVYNFDINTGFTLQGELLRSPGDLYRVHLHPDGNEILYGTSSLKTAAVSSLGASQLEEKVVFTPSRFIYTQKYVS